MNRYFLVDYERIHNQKTCLNGIETLTAQDTVYILFSGEETGVSFSVMEKISASKAKIIRKLVDEETEDTMQYVIGFYIGYVAGKEKDNNYALAVISDETFGFLPKLGKVNLYVGQTIGKAISVMPQPTAQERSNSEWENKFSEIMDGLGINGGSIESELSKTLKKARETADSIAAQTKVKDLISGDLADAILNALKPLIDPEDTVTPRDDDNDSDYHDNDD